NLTRSNISACTAESIICPFQLMFQMQSIVITILVLAMFIYTWVVVPSGSSTHFDCNLLTILVKEGNQNIAKDLKPKRMTEKCPLQVGERGQEATMAEGLLQ